MERIAALEDEVKRLKSDIEDIKKKISTQEEFVDLGPVKIKMGRDGNRLPSCYCPQCGGNMPVPGNIPGDGETAAKHFGLACMKGCGYRVSYDFVKTVLTEWDESR